MYKHKLCDKWSDMISHDQVWLKEQSETITRARVRALDERPASDENPAREEEDRRRDKMAVI